MKKSLFLFVFLFACQFLHAQTPEIPEEPEGNFLYLRDNRLFLEDEFSYKGGLFKNKFELSNGQEIHFSEVKYFKVDKGTYGYLAQKALFGSEGFEIVTRDIAGTINLFYNIDYSSDGSGNTSRNINYYFARGLGDLQALNHDNLKSALVLEKERFYRKTNEEVNTYLDKGLKKTRNKKILIFGGLGVVLTGVVVAAIQQQDSGNVSPAGLAITAAGIPVVVVGLFTKPEKQYIKAIEAYNKTY